MKYLFLFNSIVDVMYLQLVKRRLPYFASLAFIVLVSFLYSYSSAQTMAAPKVYFPLKLSSTTEAPSRYQSDASGTANPVSAVVDGVRHDAIDHRHNVANGATSFQNVKRLRIANAAGDNTSTSFFGINTATGHDVDAFTISCWIYVNPDDTEKRYIFYGADASNRVGFGLSHLGPDLYLIKYVNNGQAVDGPGGKLSTTVVGNSWEGSFRGPASFTAGEGWYHVIVVQAPYYTRVFVGMPLEIQNGKWAGTKSKFNTDFSGNMVLHGKQDLSSFTKWGMGVPEGNETALPVRKMNDFMVFDYDMTEAQAEALYHCQTAGPSESCFGAAQNYDQEFAVIGDYGCDGGVSTTPAIDNPEEKVANMVKSWSPGYILSVGDDSYSNTIRCNGHTYQENVGKYYQDYINNENILANKFYPVMGNHDRDCPPGLTSPYICPGGTTSYRGCSCLWEEYFPTQKYAPEYNATLDYAPNGGRYYSFVKGNIQFFAINSNTEDPDGNVNYGPQALWLKVALANSTATFKVVYMHHPPYTSKVAGHGGNAAQAIMATWKFKEWGADIVIAGDNHFYERSDFRNLTYIVNGTGGYPGLSHATTPALGRREQVEDEFGAMRVASNDSIMQFRFYSIDPAFPANRSKDRLRDQFWLYKRIDNSIYARKAAAQTIEARTTASVAAKTILEEKSGLTFAVFPNPTSGELTVRFGNQVQDNVIVRIMDISGREVYTQKTMLSKGAHEVLLGNLKTKGIAPGVYFLQVTSSQGTKLVKVVLQ